MIPVSYIMLDLGGIDLADVKGNVYPGLYNKIYSSLNACQEVVLCNWFVAGILIPPTYCAIDISVSGVISLNDIIFIYSDDTIQIPTMGTVPITEQLSVGENGTYEVPEGVDGFNPVIVNVPPNLVQLTITENGEYLPTSGYDGFSKVIANVPPVLSWPSVSEAINDSRCVAKLIETLPYEVPYVSQSIATFYSVYARAPKPAGMVSEHTYVAGDINKTISELGLTFAGELEYYGNVYGYSDLISNCGLVLLGDFSQNYSVGPFTLLDSINNYSGVVLNGIYQQNRTSGYNTSMLYSSINLGVGYWAGMKDRNHTYDCFVTFDTDTQVTLSGNKQVIIYGIP